MTMSGPEEPPPLPDDDHDDMPPHVREGLEKLFPRPQEMAEGMGKIARGLGNLFVRLGPPSSANMEEFEKLTGFNISQSVPAAKIKSLKAVVGELMWLAYLPAEEQDTFWWELYTAMDEVHSSVRPEEFGAYAAKAVGPLLYQWRATAQAYADELPEIIATAESGDFGEVPPPYMPRYAVHSIISAGGPDRYRVVKVEGGTNGHYVLKPLFSSAVRADLVLWAWEDCDEHTTLEWVDNKPVYALKVHDQRMRTLSGDELAELGVKPGEGQ